MTSPLDFATHLARQAGASLRKAFSLSGTVASMKPDRSFVTQADVASDRLITSAIQEHYPGETIISEELHHDLPSLTSAMWIVDPLDGTTNFSLGLHVWGVLITRLLNGQPELSVQYFPMLDELYTAQRGQGAWLNGEPIHTRSPDPSQPYGFFACCSRTHRRYDIAIRYKPRILGAAAYSFCMLARGTALIALEVTPKIWDIAAAWLLVQEAGGVMHPFDRAAPFPLTSGIDVTSQSFPTIAAATPALLETAMSQISLKHPAT